DEVGEAGPWSHRRLVVHVFRPDHPALTFQSREEAVQFWAMGAEYNGTADPVTLSKRQTARLILILLQELKAPAGLEERVRAWIQELEGAAQTP
ncbi:MAG: hypothetical protein ACK4Z6_06395, partial [Candidatus Methylomirabilales bacterium]